MEADCVRAAASMWIWSRRTCDPPLRERDTQKKEKRWLREDLRPSDLGPAGRRTGPDGAFGVLTETQTVASAADASAARLLLRLRQPGRVHCRHRLQVR